MDTKGKIHFDVEKFEQVSKDFFKLSEQIQELVWSKEKSQDVHFSPTSFVNFSKLLFDASQEFMRNPSKVNEASGQLFKDVFDVWQKALGQKSDESKLADKRFKDPLWEQNPVSSIMMQSYLIYARWVDSVANDLDGLDEDTRRKIKFYSRQFVDAVSPSNFAWANPTVLKATWDTHGENLIKGMGRFLEDLKNGTSLVNIQNTDRSAFKLGRDLATTPGKVVYQNDLIQLIQYEPITKKVNSVPLLVVPAWINKFYILDLQPKNSFVKWLVEQGHTVFIISWVNPGSGHKDTSFEDYLKKGSQEAIRVMQDITGQSQVNLVGFCLGGISLMALIGGLQRDAKKHIKSLTLMASPIDFSQAGELTIFTDNDYMEIISGRLKSLGLLDGAAMGATFNMLRANDLIWSAFINNYLLGKDPTQFDMLYWNADTTNLPAAMFKFYIYDICLKNAFMKKGAIEILGKPVDISRADIPIFMFGAQDDHIAPWKSIYAAIDKLHGPVKFVLGESGHVAGVINHPGLNKYGHWKNDEYPNDAGEWFDRASYSKESWWVTWNDWVKDHTGESVDAKERVPGNGTYKAIEDAPGSYVLASSVEALKNK